LGEHFSVETGNGVLGAVLGVDGSFIVDGSFSRVVISRTPFEPPVPAAEGRCRVVTDACIAGGGSVVRGGMAELRIHDAQGTAVSWAAVMVDGVQMTADGDGRLVLPAVWQDTVVTCFCLRTASATISRGRAREPAMEGLYKMPEMRNITV